MQTLSVEYERRAFVLRYCVKFIELLLCVDRSFSYLIFGFLLRNDNMLNFSCKWLLLSLFANIFKIRSNQIWKTNVTKQKCEQKMRRQLFLYHLESRNSCLRIFCFGRFWFLSSLAPCTDDDTASGIETAVCAFFTHICAFYVGFSDLDNTNTKGLLSILRSSHFRFSTS